jgi:hypothetical protein
MVEQAVTRLGGSGVSGLVGSASFPLGGDGNHMVWPVHFGIQFVVERPQSCVICEMTP